jgi:hypothetical protein
MTHYSNKQTPQPSNSSEMNLFDLFYNIKDWTSQLQIYGYPQACRASTENESVSLEDLMDVIDSVLAILDEAENTSQDTPKCSSAQ